MPTRSRRTSRRSLARGRSCRPGLSRRGYLIAGLGLLAMFGVLVIGTLWSTSAARIDARLHGDTQDPPRVFGRPFVVRVGQSLSPAQLEARLNDLGYARRESPETPGEFGGDGRTLRLIPRGTEPPAVTIEFSAGARPAIARMTNGTGRRVASVTLDAPLLADFATGEKRRFTPLSDIPPHVRQAVLAIEDRRFYDHPGVDVIRSVAAIFTNLFGNRDYLVGGSTITQQIVKNEFLTREQTMRRKLQEQFMAVVLESRLSKDAILELYLNDMVLGQRGPFAIHGVSEAARIFFGKDIRNVSVAEAATLAGLLQSPSRLAPFRNPERTVERRNVVLGAMVDAGFLTAADAETARAVPLDLSTRALENEAPYFVDYVAGLLDQDTAVTADASAVEVHTTLDLHLQRLAQEAVGDGIAALDARLSGRTGQVQAALVAVDTTTGDILAMVGGRAYDQSQFNRAVNTRRQPGSVFKPFVYLAAFERVVDDGLAAPTPASVILDEPTVFLDGDTPYAPGNYQEEYDGPVTFRQALARSRNIPAIKVAEEAGYARVAALWQRVGVGTPARPYPSIALGVFEASPLEIAQAYTIFTHDGRTRPLRAITRIASDGTTRVPPVGRPRPVARPDATYLVTNMLQAVMDEGTGAGARAQGFVAPAAGKSGTTNNLRDAWFVGFTPDILTVVWIGYDDNQPVGLGGSQAALPIWTAFMRSATAGRSPRGFPAPDGVVVAEIDPDTGGLAGATCPRRAHQAFLEGTEPSAPCGVHRPEP